ncbi:MAG TPA: helix-turn-helix transcriptional regulator [Blastocatellia bacterium]|nr:helix-turn-helix transcriptional regulator [Blastocatellia bacterium]
MATASPGASNRSAKTSWRSHSTIYPSLLKLEQEGYITSEWRASDNNRRAKYYKLTRAGRKRLAEETQKWETTTAILARFFAPPQES